MWSVDVQLWKELQGCFLKQHHHFTFLPAECEPPGFSAFLLDSPCLEDVTSEPQQVPVSDCT